MIKIYVYNKMKFLVTFEPANKRENSRGMSVLHGATVPIDLTEEHASAKGIQPLLPEVFKTYIEDIMRVTIAGKDYDSNTSFAEAVKEGGFIRLKVKMPSLHK